MAEGTAIFISGIVCNSSTKKHNGVVCFGTVVWKTDYIKFSPAEFRWAFRGSIIYQT